MAEDHYHECLHCGDIWLCPTLCARCAEKRQSDPSSPISVIELGTAVVVVLPSGEKKEPRLWLISCSCGWGGECVSAWQAQAAAKLRQRLGGPDVRHAVRVEAPEPLRRGN